MERQVIGLTEKIKIKEKTVTAKIDTGAASSSINKKLVEHLKPEQIKYKRIKSALGTQRRPVIELEFELNGKIYNDKFTLSDRSNLRYKVLIGKNILKKEKFMVDPLK